MTIVKIPSTTHYLARSDGEIIHVSGRILPQSISRGYRRVCIYRKYRYVHSLVCEAFHGLRPDGLETAHADGNRDNNTPENLRWATAQENTDDKRRHGTIGIGSKHAQARLTESQAAEIKSTYISSMGAQYVKRGTREALAKKFDVSIAAIKDIIRGKNWKHVVIDLPFAPPPDGSPQ